MPVRPRLVSTRARWDGAGVLLWSAWSAWSAVGPGPVDLRPNLLLLGAYVAARVSAAVGPVLPLAVSAAVAVVVATGGVTGPTAGHLGYANATAALAALGAAAAGLAAASGRRRVVLAAAPLVLVLAGAPWLLGAQAAAATAVVVVAATALVAVAPPGPLPAPRTFAAVGVLVLGVVVAVPAQIGARVGGPGAVPSPPLWLRQLSERRADLWHDAVAIAAEHPWSGAGDGSFSRLSPAAADPDTPLAHSLLLQTAAEQGWAGAALLSCLLVWALARTATTSSPVAVPAAAGWLAFQLQAAVDYVASFFAVLALAAVVQGLGAGLAEAQARALRRAAPAALPVAAGELRTAPRPPG